MGKGLQRKMLIGALLAGVAMVGACKKKEEAVAAGGGSASALPKTLDQLLDPTRSTDRWIASANATWLDAVEASALERHGVTAIGTIYDIFGEVFSVSPLIGLAAVLSGCDVQAVRDNGGPGNVGELRATNVLCTDWQGGAVSVRVRPLD